MRVSKLMMPAVTLAGALALAGCGGGSGGGSGGPCDHGANDDGTCRPDPNIALRTTANTEISEAIAAAAGLGDSPSAGDVAAARTAYDEAVAAINALPSGERNAQLGRLVTANGQIALHEGVQVRSDAAYAKVLIDVLSNPAPTGAENPATSTRNPGSAFADDGVTDPLVGTTIAPVSGGAPKITGTTGADFQADSPNQAMPIENWNGHSFSRVVGGNGEELWVYDNIDASGSKVFAEVYNGLDIDTGDLDTSKIAGGIFDEQGTHSHGTTLKFKGTYDGASGTYSCTASCGSSRNGSILTLENTADDDSGAAGWDFKADSGATVSVADTDHLHFGGWLQTDDHGDPLKLHVFADGALDYVNNTDSRTTATPVGTATYKGGAAGMYAIDRLGGTASGGTWTAKSTLNAEFGSNAVTGTISGKIHDFVSSGQSMPWDVTLNDVEGRSDDSTNIVTAGVDPTSTTTWKIGTENARGTGGTWTGTFYGNGSDHNGQPSGIAGTFDARYGSDADDHSGRMSGAFGATQ